jgi:putative membrane protein
LVNISASLLVSASSLRDSASALATSASTALSTNNSQTTIVNDIRAYTSSLKSAISVNGSDLTVLGNLTVQGDTTTLNTATLIVEDKLIVIASGSSNSAEADGGGIYISGADASITWNAGQSRIDVNKPLNIVGNITLTGTVDGTEISQLSSSFNAISSSYLLESASVSASIKTLNAYTASNNSNITALHTATASLNTFTSSTYTTFSASVDSRLDSVEGSIGGAGIGSTVNDLIVSASASVLINTQQQITLNVLANGSPSASVNSVIRLAATASNLTGQVTNQETRLISQTGSINTLFQSASSLTSSIAAIVNLNNQQSDKLSLLENFTGSTFTNYTQSVSQSITQLSASIGGGNISGLVNGLTSSVSNLTITQSGISASNSALSASYNAASSSFRIQISQLQDQKDSYVDFVSGSRSGSYMSFPPFSQSVDDRFGSMLSNINQLSSSSFLDSEQVTYSASVALVTSASQGSLFNLSSSIWNTATGLSKSINTSISESFRSASNSINSIVVGTGFIPRPEFNNITSSFSASISASNAFSASVTRSVNNNVLSASALQTTASNLSAYTSSLQLALQPNGNNVNVSGNLYVSGNIIAQQYIVSSSEIYITQSNYNYSGSNLFGNDYGDEHTFSGSIKLFGPLVMRAGLLGQGSQPTFIDVAGSITSSGTLNSNGVSSSYISASTFVSASNFYGEYNGVSTQVHLSQSIGYNSLTASISGAINAASNSLSASITTTIDTLSGSVDVLFTSASSLRISASANRNNIIFLYTSASSLETSASLLSVITSASIASGSANKQSGSVLFTSASSLQLSASALQTSASVMITSASNLSAYTHSLQQAISVTGSNTRILGNVEVTSNLIVSGTITAQEYYSELISSSIIYESGSTKFGDDGGDNHNFTGSVYVVGSISSSATITAATHSGYINANNGVVSGSSQFVEYGGALTSSNTFIGTQTTNGVLKVSGSTTLTGSVGVDLRSGSEFYVRNGVTRIDSVLFVTDNDYVNSSYVGGNVSVNNYLASGYTAHYDGGVQITGSLNVKAGQNGSGSYFIGNLEVSGGSIIITGSNSNLQVMGNTSVSGNLNSTNISASSNLYGAGLEINGNSRLNGQVDLDTTQITIGAGANAVVDETRMNTLNLRVDSDTFFNSNITAISGSTRFKSVAINDLSMSRIPYVDSTDTLVDSANFTYNGVTFKVGGGAFEIDDATGNIRTSGSLKVDGATTLHSTLNVTGSVGITGSLIVTGSTIISSSLRVGNTASFAHLNVTGSTILSNRLQVGTNAAISGNLGVIGSVALSSSLFVSGNITASANANISGDVAITGSLSAVGPIIQLGNLPFVDRTIISGALELSGSYHTMTTNLKATGSTSPADAIYRLTEAQAWSSSFTTDNTSSGAWIRTPDEYLEYFVGQGSNKRRYITPVWLDETLYADDYFDISVTVGADSDYVF